MYQDYFEVEDLEFEESTHSYLYKGVLVPSVTQLIKKKFPKMYEYVPKSILETASAFGSNVHKAIECDCKKLPIPSLSIQESICYSQYLKLKEEHNIEPIASEVMVHHNDSYAGCTDLLAIVDGELALIDVKTTTQLKMDYLEIQLALYEKALISMGFDKDIKKYYCLHIPKGKLGKLVEVRQMRDEEVDNFLLEVGVE